MPYDDLISALKASATERITEIQDRAQAEAQKILKEAEERAQSTRSASLEEAAREVRLERSKLMAKAGAEKRMALARVKDDLFQQVFARAVQQMASARNHPGYRASFQKMLSEVTEELRGEEIRVHIDPHDEVLCREILGEMKRNCEIVTDITTVGGLNATSADERLMVFNTFESRLQRAKELMISEIMSALYGD
ncbi:MAG TPA: V-type ATP synthase subunit E [Methanomicrobiales archaeon]|nr:V-type ATP synthase subunit E [Methanomicrobiales archaeon]